MRKAPAATFVRSFVAAFALATMTAGAVEAQNAPTGATLDLVGGATTGYSTSSLFNSPSTVGPTLFQRSSSQLDGAAQLVYGLPLRRFNFGAGLGSNFKLYRTSAGQVVPVGHTGSAGVGFIVSRRITAQIGVVGAYIPRYQFEVVPGLNAAASTSAAPSSASSASAPTVPIAAPDYTLVVADELSYATTARLNYTPSKHSVLSLDADFGHSDFKGLGVGYDHEDAGATFTRSVTQNLSFRLGYHYRTAQYRAPGGTGTPFRSHDFDVGPDYSRTLPFSQTTTFSFHVGASAIQSLNTTRYFVVGSATVVQRLSRTWAIDVGYNRGMNFVSGLAAPAIADTVFGSVGGPFSRRMSAVATIGYSRGAIGFSQNGNNFSTYQAAASLNWTFPHQISAFGEYFYYHNAFGGGVLLLQGLTPQLDRDGVRVGVNWRFDVPLIGPGHRRMGPSSQPYRQP